MYGKGEGVSQNFEEAARWTWTATQHGDVDAKSDLGRMHGAGEGAAQNNIKAVRWMYKAANRGRAEARRFLNNFSRLSGGVPFGV
jgi:TPR repeat protein